MIKSSKFKTSKHSNAFKVKHTNVIQEWLFITEPKQSYLQNIFCNYFRNHFNIPSVLCVWVPVLSSNFTEASGAVATTKICGWIASALRQLSHFTFITALFLLLSWGRGAPHDSQFFIFKVFCCCCCWGCCWVWTYEFIWIYFKNNSHLWRLYLLLLLWLMRLNSVGL